MEKPTDNPSCGADCPKCKAKNACMKPWTHVVSNSVHWCMTCGHTWK